MHLTHQTPSALLQAFGLVSCITNGEFIRFEKEKKQARGIPRKTTPNCQSQLKSVSLKSKTTHSSLTTKTMSTDTRFYKKISQPFSGNHTWRHSFPPKFHLIPPKNFLFPTWKIKILHVDISKYPRGNHFSPTQPRIDMYLTLNYRYDPTSTRRACVPTASLSPHCVL